MDCDYLKYGMIISLSTDEDLFMFGQGFIDNSLLVGKKCDKESQYLFRIHPQNRYSYQSSIIDHIESIKGNQFFEKINQSIKLQSNLEAEIRSNISTEESLRNCIIPYGSIIQLEHVYSRKYISLNTKKKNIENSKLTLTLAEFSNESTHFRINPTCNYQHQKTSKVRISDKIYLSIFINRYRCDAWMHCPNDLQFINSQFELQHNFQIDTRKVVYSYDQKTALKINLHISKTRSFSDNSDYFFIIDSETGNYMSAIDTGEKGARLKITFTKDRNSNGIWGIEPQICEDRENIDNSKIFALKHLSTTKYLGFQSDFNLRGKISASCLWEFQVFNESPQNRNIVTVVHCKSQEKISCKEKYELKLSSVPEDGCILQLDGVPFSLVGEVSFLLESYSSLSAFKDTIDSIGIINIISQEKSEEFSVFTSKLITCMRKVKRFCKNKIYGMINMNSTYGKIDSQRQTMLKNQNFFKLLCDLLCSCITEDSARLIKEFNSKMSDNNEIRDMILIGKYIYRLFEVSCYNNIENQNSLFAFLEIFLNHVGLSLGASKLILSMLKENEQLLYNVHLSQFNIIKLFTRLLRSEDEVKKIEYLEFLSSICIYKGEGVTVNQENIFFSLFNRNKSSKNGIILAEYDGESLVLKLKTLKIDLRSCFTNGKLIEYKKEVEFYTGLIKLYSNLSHSRYYESSSVFVSEYPFSLLDSIIWDYSYSQEIRAAFCSLILELYIDCHPREEINKPVLLKILEESNSKIDELGYKIYNPNGMLHASWSNFSDEYDLRPFNESLKCLPNFIDHLFKHFESTSGGVSFDCLTLTLLKTIDKLIKFQILGVEPSISSEKKQFTSEGESHLVRMVKDIFPILIYKDKDAQAYPTLRRTQSKINSNVNYSDHFASIVQYADRENPIIYGGLGLANYLKAYNQNIIRNLDKNNIKNSIKIQICKILNYYLDSRQEYFLSNVFSKYNDNYIKDLDLVAIFESFPDIYKEEQLPDITEENKQPDPIYLPNLASFSLGNGIQELIGNFSLNKNWKLQKSILSIIIRNSSQRRELIKKIDKLHTIWRKEDILLVKWVKCDILSFKHYSELSEIWIDFWRYHQKMKFKYLETYDKMNQILKNLENFLYVDCILTDKGPYSSSEHNISQSHQEILYYLNFGEHLLRFVKDGMHKLVANYEKDEYESRTIPREKLTNLFANCFRVLKKFVQCNPQNQKICCKSLNFFMSNLHINIGQIPLICSILKNNKTLIQGLKIEFFETIASTIEKYGRQRGFLKLLSVVLIVNGEAIEDIQSVVLSLFASSKINTNLLFMDASAMNFQFEIENKSTPEYRDEPYDYHAALLILLSKTVYKSASNNINRAKCQSIFPLSYIFQILNLAEDLKSKINLLKLPMLYYFYTVFLENSSFRMDLSSCDAFLDYICSQDEKLNEIEEMGPQYLDFLSIFIKILNQYSAIYINQLGISYYHQTDFIVLKKFAKSLINNSNKFAYLKFSIELLEAIGKLCTSVGKRYEIPKNSKFSYGNPLDQLDLLSKSSDNYVDNSSQDKIKEWNHMKESLFSSNLLRECLIEEVIDLANRIYNLNCNTSAISFEIFTRSVVAFLHLAESQKISKSLYLGVFRVFRTMFSSRWLTQFKQENDFKTKLQNEICCYGIVSLITLLLAKPSLCGRIYRALIALSNCLLSGPNLRVQQEFYSALILLPTPNYFLQSIRGVFSAKYNEIYENKLEICSDFKDFEEVEDLTIITLRFVKKLCSNFNKPLQNYFNQSINQDQPSIILSIISMVTLIVERQQKNCYNLLENCFDTILAVIHGPHHENQQLVSDSGLGKTINLLLEITELIVDDRQLYSDYELESINSNNCMIENLKKKSLLILLNLIEGKSSITSIKSIIRDIKLDKLKEILYEIYKKAKIMDKFDYSMKDQASGSLESKQTDFLFIEKGLIIIQIILTLKNFADNELQEMLFEQFNSLKYFYKSTKKSVFTADEEQKIMLKNYTELTDEEKDKITGDSILFFQQFTGSIEIIFEEEIYQKVFYYPCEYLYLTEEMKEHFHLHSNRETDQAKLKYLLEKVPTLTTKMKYNHYLRLYLEKYSKMYYIISRFRIWNILTCVLCITLNVLNVFSYGIDAQIPSIGSLHPDSDTSFHSQTILTYTILGIIQTIASSFMLVFFIIKEGPIILYKSRKISRLNSLNSTIFVKAKALIKTIFLVVFNFKMSYHLSYEIFAILGLILHPFFYSVQLLLDLFYRNHTLTHVIRAFGLVYKSFLMVLLLWLVMSYLYGLVAYWTMADLYGPNCDNLFKCSLSMFDYTYKANGGPGGYIGYAPTPDGNHLRFFFDNSFNLGVLVMLMAIFVGTFVDTFAQLRMNHEECKNDRESKCYVCGVSRIEIEIHGGNFKNHVQNIHSEWNYVLFYSYLISKDKDCLTGIEAYLLALYNSKEITWIPSHVQKLDKQNDLPDIFSQALQNLNDQIDVIEDELKPNYSN